MLSTVKLVVVNSVPSKVKLALSVIASLVVTYGTRPLVKSVTASVLTMTFPVPFGAILMFPSTPSAIVILPLLVPLLVLRIKSPVPLVVIVAFVLESPTVTVSALSKISPDPLGTILMLPLVSVLDIVLPSMSMLSMLKLEPSTSAALKLA